MKNLMKWNLYLLMLWWPATILHAQPSATEEVQSVAAEMHETWDKPDQPLALPVIVIHHGMAIADWIQGGKGGRALLKYHAEHKHWHTLLCGGAELTSATRLQEAGMSSTDASTLAAKLEQGEQQGLTAEQRLRIESFQGVVKFSKGKPVSSTGHDMHGDMHGH